MSVLASASLTAALASAAATQRIAIRLLTGEVIVMNTYPQETYSLLYRRLWGELPEEIRPKMIGQLNLLLDGELLPMKHEPFVPSPDGQYDLLIDPVQYYVSVEIHPGEAVDMNDEKAYLLVRATVKSIEPISGEDERMFTCSIEMLFLYHRDTHTYLDLEGVAREWARNRGLYSDLMVYLTEENRRFTGVEFVEHIMNQVDVRLEPSMAGRRSVQFDLEGELTTMEEGHPSWEELFGEEQEEQEEQEDF